MPGVKDITGDVGRLSRRKALPKGRPPSIPIKYRLERKPAFNASGFFSWTLIGLFLVLQAAFIVWLVW